MDIKRNGFTLLELLIVIAIIGILISAGIVSYGSAQKKTRDSKRRADFKAIQNGFEQYYADSDSLYPLNCTAITSAYLPGGLPTDPKSKLTYDSNGTDGSGVCGTTSYYFCVKLESGAGNADNTANYQVADVDKTHYCVSNLQ